MDFREGRDDFWLEIIRRVSRLAKVNEMDPEEWNGFPWTVMEKAWTAEDNQEQRWPAKKVQRTFGGQKSQHVLQDRLCEMVADDKVGKGDILAKPIDLLWLIFHPTWDIVDFEAYAKMLWSCLTLCSPMDHSPPGSSVRGILQASILEWVAMPSSKRSSWPRYPTHICYVSCIGRWVLYHQGHLGSPYVACGYFMSQSSKLNRNKTLMVRHTPISKMLKYNPPMS